MDTIAEVPGCSVTFPTVIQADAVGTRVDVAQRIFYALRSMVFCRGVDSKNGQSFVSESSPGDCPTLQQHSEKWELNEKQHCAFVLSGAAFLQHLYNNIDRLSLESQPELLCIDEKLQTLLREILPPSGQLLLHLAGSGGTGKSGVLQALVDFGVAWKSSRSIVVTASCGAAAMLIGGSTLHSALGIQTSLHPPEPTETMRATWSEVGVLFIDEFSMISPSLFCVLDRRLRQLKVRPDVLFGGVHIIFCGDFYQLPPVEDQRFIIRQSVGIKIMDRKILLLGVEKSFGCSV